MNFEIQQKQEEIKNPEEETFKEYVEDLKLKPEDFEKVILDVGAGDAYFARWAKEHKVSSEIYSLEPFQKMKSIEKSLVASAEEIPIADEFFELVISNGAIPNIYLGEKDVKEKVKKSFSEMLRVLKDGGEIRLAHVLQGDKYENQKILMNATEEVLKELEINNIKIEKIYTPINDTYEWDGHEKKSLLAKSFLIILQKPKINNF